MPPLSTLNCSLLSEFDLSSDEESKLIENLARAIVNRGLEAPAIMFLETVRPIAFLLSQLGVVALGPLLWFFDLEGSKYTAVFMRRGNVGKIIDRVEAMAKERP